MIKSKYIYVIATYDTKTDEIEFIKALIKDANMYVKTLDISTTSPDQTVADYSNELIAGYSPEPVFCGDRGIAIKRMGIALTNFMKEHQDEISGVIGLGGSGGTAMICPALQELPIGLPKLMVSTMASGNIAKYIGSSDINMMYSVTDIAGVNRVSRPILINAAHEVMGAVYFKAPASTHENTKPAVGLTMFGVTTPCVLKASEILDKDNDSIVFHATGAGGMSMERLMDDNLLNGVLDITTTEVCDYLFGGVLACGEDRFGAIARTKIPCVMSAGALDMINFGNKSTVPEKFSDRLFYEHNAEVTLMRTTPEENRQLGEWIGKKLNACEGEIRFLIPLQGFSALDSEGQAFWNPEADQAFIEVLEKTLVQTDKRKIIKVDAHINSDEFAQQLVNAYQKLF